mgnify:CR=1 FL=1|nr:hypothetical protein [uncultured Campylobacter sp.]
MQWYRVVNTKRHSILTKNLSEFIAFAISDAEGILVEYVVVTFGDYRSDDMRIAFKCFRIFASGFTAAIRCGRRGSKRLLASREA